MPIKMPLEKYAALPDRNVVTSYERGQFYRDERYPEFVFLYCMRPLGEPWWAQHPWALGKEKGARKKKKPSVKKEWGQLLEAVYAAVHKKNPQGGSRGG